jgi:hypothetical protein
MYTLLLHIVVQKFRLVNTAGSGPVNTMYYSARELISSDTIHIGQDYQ